MHEHNLLRESKTSTPPHSVSYKRMALEQNYNDQQQQHTVQQQRREEKPRNEFQRVQLPTKNYSKALVSRN